MRSFLHQLQRAVGCLFPTPLYASGNDPGRRQSIAFQVPGPQRLPGTDEWFLRLVLEFRVVRSEGRAEPWRVSISQYVYEFRHPAAEPVFGLH